MLLSRGRTAEVYAWENDCVLKLFYDWCDPLWINQEADVAVQLVQAGLPVPACHGMVELDKRQGIVFQRLQGPTLLALISKQPLKLPEYARLMAALHQKIHQVSVPQFHSLKKQLESSIQRVEQLPDDLRVYCLKVLDALPEGEQLIHFDFHPDQIMMTKDGPYIIDWGSACKGDPLADVARTSLLLSSAQVQHMPWLLQILIGIARRSVHRIYMKEMLNVHGPSAVVDIDSWKIPIAAARLIEHVELEEPALLAYLQAEKEKAKSSN